MTRGQWHGAPPASLRVVPLCRPSLPCASPLRRGETQVPDRCRSGRAGQQLRPEPRQQASEGLSLRPAPAPEPSGGSVTIQRASAGPSTAALPAASPPSWHPGSEAGAPKWRPRSRTGRVPAGPQGRRGGQGPGARWPLALGQGRSAGLSCGRCLDLEFGDLREPLSVTSLRQGSVGDV